MVDSQKFVMPAQAGIQCLCTLQKFLDSRFRGNDEKTTDVFFCETIKISIDNAVR